MRKAETKRSVRLRVQELAKQKGLSDLELAHLAQVDVRVIRRMWANQYEHLLLHQLVRVAEALGVPTCELIEEENNK
jgi:transcriptional regulator with XRE-family HTH domain